MINTSFVEPSNETDRHQDARQLLAEPIGSPSAAKTPAICFWTRPVFSAGALLAHNAYVTGQTVHVNGGWYMTS